MNGELVLFVATIEENFPWAKDIMLVAVFFSLFFVCFVSARNFCKLPNTATTRRSFVWYDINASIFLPISVAAFTTSLVIVLREYGGFQWIFGILRYLNSFALAIGPMYIGFRIKHKEERGFEKLSMEKLTFLGWIFPILCLLPCGLLITAIWI